MIDRSMFNKKLQKEIAEAIRNKQIGMDSVYNAYLPNGDMICFYAENGIPQTDCIEVHSKQGQIYQIHNFTYDD